MEKLTSETAKEFSENEFKTFNDWRVYWNYTHSKDMIMAIEELTNNPKIIDKLASLAWVHDIGKTINNKNHAEHSVEILKKEFELDETDIDCILNHGSGGDPKTEEGRIFRFADGISLFYPETVLYWFWAEAIGDKTPFEDIKIKIKKQYNKYREAYSDSPEAIEILEKKYKLLFEESILDPPSLKATERTGKPE